MPRRFLWAAVLMLSGCSLQNPYALFGPSKVPAPASAEVAPYYPAPATASAQPPSAPSGSRPSISVSAPASAAALAVSPSKNGGDEEPIRIAENTRAVPIKSTVSPPLPTSAARSFNPPAAPPSSPAGSAWRQAAK